MPAIPVLASGTALQTDWGNTAADSFRGPGYFDIDAQVSRSFKIKEKVSMLPGMQAYNVMSHRISPALRIAYVGIVRRNHEHSWSPTSIYGTGQGASVSGRLAVLTGRIPSRPGH